MISQNKILIVEDDKKIREILNDYFVNAGFSVSELSSGDEVILEMMNNPPDLIILDIMLPGKDGITLCSEIRAFSSIPIVMLTARVDEIDRVLGLELGADDYICKPFSPREVVSRVKAILRRTYFDSESTNKELVAGTVIIDLGNHSATIHGDDLSLTPIEFDLLALLVSRPDRILTRSDLLSRIQGNVFNEYSSMISKHVIKQRKKIKYFAALERTIDSHIKNIRKKMNEILPDNNLIQTVNGRGYLLNTANSKSADNKSEFKGKLPEHASFSL